MSALDNTKLNVDQIRANDDTTTSPVSIPGLEERFASAWANFNATGTIAIRDSYNVTSLTDNGTGSYDLNLTNPLADTNAAAIASSAGVAGGSDRSAAAVVDTTTTVHVSSWVSSSGTLTDVEYISTVVFGGNS